MNKTVSETTAGIDPSILLCPDCREVVGTDLHCSGCGRQMRYAEGYYDLLPRALSSSKRGEDSVFRPGGAELARFEGYPWRKLIGRLEIERFDREVVPILPAGAFLELAGESCWAAAIYKSVNPSATVFATDLSRNAITKLAIPVGSMFPHPPDVYATVDAEVLPFQAESFDCIFVQSAMHHFPDPVQMLREVKRVLVRGGRFVAIDHSVPRHFRFLFSTTARARSETYGIQEDLVSFSRWRSCFESAGLPRNSLRVYDNPSYQRNPVFALAGKMISFLPDWLKRSLFPVGLYVIYDKA
jgi:ubiquinone/menaquinone biosynthesis C-methylase UbiE